MMPKKGLFTTIFTNARKHKGALCMRLMVSLLNREFANLAGC